MKTVQTDIAPVQERCRVEYYVTLNRNQEQTIKQLQAENAALREANRWIPCSERMPEDDGIVLVWDGTNVRRAWTYAEDRNNEWWRPDGDGIDAPTHWRPLPDPPEVSE